jgi:hypothetical protein
MSISEQVAMGADSLWLAGLRARDRDALEHIFYAYSGQVFHFLSLVEPRRSPEEACLDIFEELWHSAATDTPPGTLADWLLCRAYRIVRERASAAERETLTFERQVVVALVYGIRLPLDSILKITAMTAAQVAAHLREARQRLIQPPRR